MSLKKRPKLRNTLAFRLTLWYAGFFSISSFVAFLLFYLLITSVLRKQIDQEMLTQGGTFSSILAVRGVDALKNVAILEAQAAGERKIFFRLLSQNGDVFSSSNMSYWADIGIKRTAINRLISGSKYEFDTIGIPERKQEVRVLYNFIGPGIILQLGRSMENYLSFVDIFKKIFITTMSILVVFAAAIGWFMAKKALSGLEEVTRIATHISGTALEERVPVKRRGDEIERLADTFNQMLDRIQNLVTEIREMSDNIAHDLKSPITRIRGNAEVTLTTDSSIDEFKTMAAGTIEECDGLLDMINTLLVISKADAGVGMLKKAQLDLTTIICEAGELLQPMIEDKDIILTVHLPENSVIHGDLRMIQRMVGNLLENAIKYTPASGTIKVSVKNNPGESVQLIIADTGIGISKEDIPHIFQRFYRCDPSRHQSGIGLGLSLAKAIAEAHNGTITVESWPDKGSVFMVTFPELKSF